jgi:hypothetical protein
MQKMPNQQDWIDIAKIKPQANQVVRQKVATHTSNVLANRFLGQGKSIPSSNNTGGAVTKQSKYTFNPSSIMPE